MTEFARQQEASVGRLLRFAAAVGPHLGDGWRAVRADGWRVMLTHPDRRELSFWDDRQPFRVGIRGSYPESDYFVRGYGRWHDGITVRAGRDPASIARDITRRLLPEYETTLTAMRLWEADDCADRDARAALLARLDAVWPGTHALYGSDGPHSVRTVVSFGAHGPRAIAGTAEFSGDGREVYALNLRYLPADLAVRIAALVAETCRTEATALCIDS